MQKRLRDLDRLIKKRGLTPELEKKREEIEFEKREKLKIEKEKKYAEKYHMVTNLFAIPNGIYIYFYRLIKYNSIHRLSLLSDKN